MRRLQEVADQEFVWSHSKGKIHNWVLADDDGIVGALLMEQLHTATATDAEEQWTFQLFTGANSRTSITVLTDGHELASFEWQHENGVLSFITGQSFIWHATGFWGTQWEWVDASGKSVLRVTMRPALPTVKWRVRVDPAGRTLPEISLLALLGWYILVDTIHDLVDAPFFTLH